MPKQRADQRLVEQGLAGDTKQAAALIMAGRVFHNTARIEKAGQQIKPGTALRLRELVCPFVSRGGLKLASALDALQINPSELIALDIGASTGGFTDCLLSRNCQRVYAVDVGYGLLHPSLRDDPRVISLERTHAKELRRDQVPVPCDLAVIDVSFISLRSVVPAILPFLGSEGRLLVMVKPQFEIERTRLPEGGVIRDEAVRRSVVDKMLTFFQSLKLEVLGQADSALKGPKGNQETFIFLATNDNSRGVP